jgi:hypothetical protein
MSELNRQNNKQRDLGQRKRRKNCGLGGNFRRKQKRKREIRLLDPGMPGMKASTASLDPDYKMKDLVRQLDISRGSRGRARKRERNHEARKQDSGKGHKELGGPIRG